jgi:hypothetical protein
LWLKGFGCIEDQRFIGREGDRLVTVGAAVVVAECAAIAAEGTGVVFKHRFCGKTVFVDYPAGNIVVKDKGAGYDGRLGLENLDYISTDDGQARTGDVVTKGIFSNVAVDVKDVLLAIRNFLFIDVGPLVDALGADADVLYNDLSIVIVVTAGALAEVVDSLAIVEVTGANAEQFVFKTTGQVAARVVDHFNGDVDDAELLGFLAELVAVAVVVAVALRLRE